MAGWCGVWWLAALCGCAAALQAGRLEAGRLWAAPHAFDVETTVFLNDVARADKEVGYKIRAALHVEPVWADGHTDFLLKFQLLSPKLYLRGKHVNADFMPYDSVWDSFTDSTFYAHWSRGLIEKAYLDSSELLDVTNYKKSLLSLFQFQGLDGKHNETDVSGACMVLYETMSDLVFRKIKTECAGDGGGVVRSSRRVARYTLHAGRAALAELHAEELLALAQPALGLKARSWHSLRARAAPPARPAPPAPHASLAAALQALGAALREQPLTLAPEDDEPAGEQELLAALQETDSRAALRAEGAGQGGSAAGAAGALRLLPLLRRTSTAKLLHLLQREDMHDALPGLCRLLGLAGTRASHSAARDFLQLHTGDPLRDLAHTYLAAFALSDAPDEWAVLEVLRLGEEGRAHDVSESALLAAAAAAARLPEPAAVRDALARGLARCRDERCRALRLRALGNLRRAAPELLLEHAERGAGPAALAALDALVALPPHALRFVHLDRLGQLALNESAPLELRAAALDLVTQRRAELPAPLAHLAYALHSRGSHELRRVLWQRMAALAPIHEALRALPAMLEPELRGWNAQAHAGTSAVLTRATGWALGGWRGSLQSVQVARDGLLRRGSVQLLAEDANNHTFDALTVEVWTRGLQAFGGGGEGAEGGEGAGDEEPAAGLSLAVGGARTRDVSLFSGQAELLGHVWAGTASTPTPVLRALLPLAGERCSVPLLGGVRLRGSWRAALGVALDAAAQASLWRRTARASLRLRGGLAAEAAAALRVGGGRLEARARLRAEPRLRVAADLDFYDAVALCVRVRTDELRASRSVRLEAQQGARGLRVRRSRLLRLRTEGRTLALGRPNDHSCRTLLEAGDDDD